MAHAATDEEREALTVKLAKKNEDVHYENYAEIIKYCIENNIQGLRDTIESIPGGFPSPNSEGWHQDYTYGRPEDNNETPNE